jgi:Glycosyltransferases, probably involved in cell wall biogenesis
MLETIFFGSLLLIFYIYLGYPLAAATLAFFVRREVKKGAAEPLVTVVIAAYNEARVIGQTLENKLALDYPAEKLEIVVVSDASTDDTDLIASSFAARGVRLVRQEPRAGKTSALNVVVPAARGEIVVFSDANSLYAPDALRHIVANFADPEVGYVTGRMVYTNEDGMPTAEGCGTYMRYENVLRGIESRLGSVVGVDGGIDAVRASLYRPMSPDLLPDFVLPLRVVEQGYRVVYEPKALLCEQALKEDADEYRMRVRVSLRALWALWEMRGLLNPLRYPLFSWQLWSHKVLRYACFVFLLSAYLGNAALLQRRDAYLALFVPQSILYLGGLGAVLLNVAGIKCRYIDFAKYFCLVNAASAHAFAKFILGKKQVLWLPRKG